MYKKRISEIISQHDLAYFCTRNMNIVDRVMMFFITDFLGIEALRLFSNMLVIYFKKNIVNLKKHISLK